MTGPYHRSTNGRPQPGQADLLAELQSLRLLVEGLYAGPTPAGAEPPEQLVTLDQAAAMVGRSKRSLERYRRRLPAPKVRGVRGQASLWEWSEVRPVLESLFGRRLPPLFPGRC